jgi:hypothetical protein
MGRALRFGRRPIHDGRWGKATLEVALAIQQSAKEGREITLEHQVTVAEEELFPEDDAESDVHITARIVD